MAAGSRDEGSRSRVLIGNINRGEVGSALMMGAIAGLQQDVIHGMVVVETGPYLDDGRNKVVANALTLPDWEWLLFVDSDIELLPEHITTLLAPYAHEDPFQARVHSVIAGVYVNPFDDGLHADNIGPVVYEWGEYVGLGAEPGMESFMRVTRERLADLPPVFPDDHWADVVQVDAVGTGFMAVHRSMLTMMQYNYDAPQPWFHEPVINGVHMGEDMGFCYRLREMGYPVLVHRGVTPVHRKTMKLI